MRKKWQIADKKGEELGNLLPELGEISLQLLYNRGLIDKETVSKFLNPDYEDMSDPFLFKDMEKALDRIFSAIENNEKIVIFGDYDADGVTSTVVLKKILTEIQDGNLVDIYIPHRGREGYGLNKKALKYLKEKGNSLIITVDCGVSNFEEVKYANSLGLDIIITDHHHPPKILPPAYAIINPKIAEDNYPFRELAGVGVAFKLAQALIQKGKKIAGQNDDNKWESIEKWMLYLVAVGTVADCCPLVSENRILVKYGLIVLNKTKNIGLNALINLISLAKKQNNGVICSNKKDGLKIDAWTIGFQIGPRLNAAGRLDHANTAYELLITQDEKSAEQIAEKLNETNSKRQAMTEKAVKEAIEIINEEQLEKNDVVLFAKKDWDPGIIGLIAGRVCEYFNKPVFIFTKIEGGFVASGRSIPEFNLVEALENVKNYLKRYGGHSQACGLSLKDENEYSDFKEAFLKVAEIELEGKELAPVLDIEAEISLKDANWQLIDDLKMFEPYGQANHCPLFLFKNLKILEIKLVGADGKHLKLKLADTCDNRIINAIGFSLNNEEKNWGDKLHTEDIVDVAAFVDVNEWNGNRELQLRIEDIRLVA